jgi:flagellar hook-associated protein 3 FlgL
MRVTDSMRYSSATLSESRASQQLFQQTQVASSGVRVNAPSDDPAAYATIAGIDSRVSVLSARSSAATLAANDLSLADQALSSASDLLIRAQSIATEASNGTWSATDRATAATEVSQIRTQMIALANTRGTSGYIFGGTATGKPPIDATGSFVGNDTATHVEIADGVLATTNASGAKAFTAAGGQDVLATLQSLSDGLAANDLAAIQGSLDPLIAAHQQVTAARVDAGVSSDRLTSAASVATAAVSTLRQTRSSEANADPAQTYTSLTAAQTAYEQAIAVTRQILSLSSLQRAG